MSLVAVASILVIFVVLLDANSTESIINGGNAVLMETIDTASYIKQDRGGDLNESQMPKTSVSLTQRIISNSASINSVKDELENLNKAIISLTRRMEAINQALDGYIVTTKNESNQRMNGIIAKQSIIQQEIEHLTTDQRQIKQLISEYNHNTNVKLDSFVQAQNSLMIDVGNNSYATPNDIAILNNTLSKKYFIITTTGSALLVAFVVVIWLFHKRTKLPEAFEKSIIHDAKMSEILENQLILLKNKKSEKEKMESIDKVDHSFPAQVGTEIFRMRKRISNMHDNTKGINALKNALMRLEVEFNKQGYEIYDLTGKLYKDGLIVKIVNTFEQDDLEPGVEIITRMITPQIAFDGVIVSHGEAELAVSSKINNHGGEYGKAKN